MTVIKSLLVYLPSFCWSPLSIFDLNSSLLPILIIPLHIQIRPSNSKLDRNQKINPTKTKRIKTKCQKLDH